jgi:hypothetical protein
MGLELGAARAFVLARRLREITDERDRDAVDAFFSRIDEDRSTGPGSLKTASGVRMKTSCEAGSTYCGQASRATHRLTTSETI